MRQPQREPWQDAPKAPQVLQLLLRQRPQLLGERACWGWMEQGEPCLASTSDAKQPAARRRLLTAAPPASCSKAMPRSGLSASREQTSICRRRWMGSSAGPHCDWGARFQRHKGTARRANAPRRCTPHRPRPLLQGCQGMPRHLGRTIGVQPASYARFER